MSAALAVAVIASAAIGAGATVYAGEEQKKAAEEAQKKQEQAAKVERDRLALIEANTKPADINAQQSVKFGNTSNAGSPLGSVSQFLVQKNSGLNTKNSSSGLGLTI